MPAPSPRFLDVPHALDMLGSDADVRDILSMALPRLHEDLQAIQAHLTRGDGVSAHDHLHALKGVLPLFCAQALVDRLIELERYSKTAGANDIAVRFADLGPDLEVLAQEVSEHLDLPPRINP